MKKNIQLTEEEIKNAIRKELHEQIMTEANPFSKWWNKLRGHTESPQETPVQPHTPNPYPGTGHGTLDYGSSYEDDTDTGLNNNTENGSTYVIGGVDSLGDDNSENGNTYVIGGNTPETYNTPKFEPETITPQQPTHNYRVAGDGKFNGYTMSKDENGNDVRTSNYEKEYYGNDAEEAFVNIFVPAYNSVNTAFNELQKLKTMDFTTDQDLTSKLMRGLSGSNSVNNSQGYNNAMRDVNTEIQSLSQQLESVKGKMKQALNVLGVKTSEDYQHYNMQEQRLRKIISNSIQRVINEQYNKSNHK